MSDAPERIWAARGLYTAHLDNRWPTPVEYIRADRIEALEQQVADLLADVPCACGYDNPTDVCMKHLPLVRDLTVKLAKAVEALLLARVHVANNEQGWSVGRASARSDLKIINATLAEIEGTNAP